MDVSGLTNGLMSITGATEKAKLLVCDKRVNAEKHIDPKGTVSPGSTAPMGGATVPSGATSALQKAGSTAASVAGTAAKGIMGAVSGGAAGMLNQASVISDGEFNKAFTVQFNPATLNISGFSGGSYEVVDSGGGQDAIRSTPLNPNIALNVTLIFDQTELATSFPMDSVGFSISQAASTAIKSITAATNSLGISVQAATEGIIGVLQNPYTKLICFKWGNLRYKGVLKSVNATYKMFDIYGRPVRSEVALSMYLADDDIKEANGTAKLGMWKDAYDNCFDDTKVAAVASANKAKKWANIIQG